MKKVFSYLIFFLFLLFFSRELSTTFEKSITCDETVHIPAGYYYVKKGDYFINYAHPPFSKTLSGIFISKIKIFIPENIYRSLRMNEWELGMAFFYLNREYIDKIVLWARFPMILLGLLLGFFIYLWSKDLYGKTAGLFSLFLFTFCPNFLAYSCLVITDVGFTLFFIMTIYFFWRYLENQTKKDLILTGISFGLALSSKFSGVYVLSIIVLIFIVYGILRKKLKLDIWHYYIFSFLIIPFLVILIFYQLNLDNLKYFIIGAKRIFSETGKTGQDLFLNGKFSKTGFRSYFLWVFLYKTPISFLVILFISFLIRPKIDRDEKFLIMPAIIYFIIASISKKQVGGVRYILPVYALFYIFVGRIFIYNDRLKIKRVVLFFLIFWYFLVSLKIHPHYLAYFNQICGGPDNGWKKILNSDWGQDLISLKDFLEREGNPEIMTNIFGVLPPEVYGITPYEPFLYQVFMSLPEEKYHINSENPKKEYLVISVNCLAGLHYQDPDIFWYLKEKKPYAKLGYTIYVYDITKDIKIRERIAETLEKYGYKRQAERQKRVIENLKRKEKRNEK
ncbi:MAG: ArnT family glycosyltransferase [Candidatus Ratteibacteria bacterium]